MEMTARKLVEVDSKFDAFLHEFVKTLASSPSLIFFLSHKYESEGIYQFTCETKLASIKYVSRSKPQNVRATNL